MRSPAENAELALLLEVATTPTPGNVDRERDHPDLRFEQFLAGGVGAGGGLRAAQVGVGVGESFERAVAGMADQRGGNTQFGALLLAVPLVKAAAGEEGELTREAAAGVVEATDAADAAGFYRAFEHVDVAVGDPPTDAPDLDVRRGADAVPAVEERGLTLSDVMELSARGDGDGDAPGDGVAGEWVGGFERTFRTADRIAGGSGYVADRAARTFLALLAEEADSHVATRHGPATAERVRERADDLNRAGDPVRENREAVEAFGDDLLADGVNPGTTADILAAGLFVALERDGVEL